MKLKKDFWGKFLIIVIATFLTVALFNSILMTIGLNDFINEELETVIYEDNSYLFG